MSVTNSVGRRLSASCVRTCGQSGKPRVLIVAGEISGDFYAASLIDVLHSMMDIDIFAVGGPQTGKRQVHLLFDSSNWAAIGYLEAIKQAPRLLLVLRRLKRFLTTQRPDLLILVDYPGFNMRLVRAAAHLGIPTLYYFPPSKFAVDPRNVADAARNITCVAANFRFTYEVYKAAGANVEFVGHPLRDHAIPSMSRTDACQKFGVDPGRPIIGLCPGSRRSELELLLPVMLEAGKLLHAHSPELQFLVPVISTEGSQVFGFEKQELRAMLAAAKIPVSLVEGKMYDVMAVSHLLLISSGTATLEASHVGTPMVICYRVSLITEIQARLFYRLPQFIGLPNIILKQMAIPELIQWDFTPEKLARQAIELLENQSAYAAQQQALARVVAELGERGAHQRVAKMAYDLLYPGS